ncbi:OmpA family protein [Dysgonomonas sp. Marseille-P4677]|uniref:PorE family type IX secretion system protein n=1 Tax=Dysgonomonas sp. Marseille-P4677 TaxID=2364790 RepID=UPI001913ADDA|nr:OmpA family protein [Dysgonomonas sp. Marseille-P4677]MBK5720309.1 OmpA family protein [Dysgonomonas sp. Marseille-P4677]
MKKYIYYISGFILFSLCFGACKSLKLEDADKKFTQGEYFVAADMYRKIYRKTSPKKRELRGDIALRMAESYRLINYPARANAGYANAIRYKVNDSTVTLQYARSLHKAGEYKQAAKYYEEFLKIFPNNKFALNGLEGTKLASIWKANPTLHTVKRMDLFNSNRGEFSPMLLPPDYEQVYFSSNRKEATGDTISGITGTKLNDLFMSRKDENGNWMKVEHVESAINTPSDEGTPSFSITGTTMYYTHTPLADSVGIFYPMIYVSQRSGGSWGNGTKIEINKRDTLSVYAHPTINSTGDVLYFVSDRAGSYGGKDIWKANLVGDLVESVENLGPDINTAGDEMFPYLRNDSTLYFASDGHIGMGGLDIYKASYNSAVKRWDIENLKSPINSYADDFGITFEGEKENGFFSSNRGDGKGFDHIYSFSYPVIETTVEGYIVDTDDEFVTNATIRVVGRDGTNKKFLGKNNGTYSLDIARGQDYVFLASAENYLNTRMSLKTIEMDKDSTYLLDFILTPINKPVVLENIFYDFDKATLRPESKEELDGLIDLLNQNPNVTIELSAHTDRKGTDEYNNRLSQRRAESVVQYLINRGINKERLTAVGKGKTDPKKVTKAVVKKYNFLNEGDVLNETFIEELSPEQQDMADQVNRRTEFRVLSITYNLE